MASNHLCICGKSANKKCALCGKLYCSAECQRKDWQAHKASCRKEVDADDLGDPRVLKNARIKLGNECHCTKCAALCRIIPGAYDPYHVEQLSKENPGFLHTLTMDWFSGDKKHHPYLRPATVDEVPGNLSPFAPSGVCSNLGPEGCQLPRDKMPLGCIVATGCRSTKTEKYDKAGAPKIWGTPKGKEIIDAFVATNRERDPHARLDINLVDVAAAEYLMSVRKKYDLTTDLGRSAAALEVAVKFHASYTDALAMVPLIK
jgi:hypothetical protein